MKICILGRKYPPSMGGIATYYYNLANYYANQGHYVIVITQERNNLSSLAIENGVRVFRINCMDLPFIRGLHFSWKAKNLFWKLNKKENFDIILSNIPQIPDIFLRKTLNQRPFLVHTVQTTFKYEKESIKGKDFFELTSIEKGYRLFTPLFQLLEKYCCKKSDLLLPTSQALKKELFEIGVNSKKINLVYNGIDTELFKPLKKDSSLIKKYNLENSFKIVFVGRFVKRKGIDCLLLALKKLKSERPQINFKCLIVGAGDSLEIKDKINSFELQEQIIFTGFISREDIPKIHSIADIFVIPSLYEGFPFTLLEAMSCGKAVVGTDIGGINEVLVNEQNGLIIKPENYHSLFESICKIYDNKTLRHLLEKNARKTIEENYSISIIGNQNLNIYDSLIEKGKNIKRIYRKEK